MQNRKAQYILAFDTSTEHLSVAVLNAAGDVLSSYNELAFRHLSDNLHPALEKCIQDAGIQFANLSHITCTKGPGSFTSVRVGLSAAKGLAFALNTPVITFNSLEVLASHYLSENCTKAHIHTWIEAHGGNVYCATFNSQGALISEPESLPASIAAQKIQDGDTLIGNGTAKHLEDIPNHAQTNENYTYIKASHLAVMALKAIEENAVNIGDVKPLYIHPLHYHKTYNADGTPIEKK